MTAKPKLIKYREMNKNLPIDEDMAVAEFRAFYAKADILTKRIQNPEVIGDIDRGKRYRHGSGYEHDGGRDRG